MMSLIGYTKGFGPHPEDAARLLKYRCHFHLQEGKTKARDVK